MKNIFSSIAPKCWKKDLRVIPLAYAGKTPVPGLTGWPGYLSSPPSDATRAEWLAKYGDSNLGLLLGQKVGNELQLLALDADDDRYCRLIEVMLSRERAGRMPTLVAKRGKKGATYFALAHPKLRSQVITGANDMGNIDVLAGGKYTVLPPSIHPDTNAPYVWTHGSILEADLLGLPEVSDLEIAILKFVAASPHTTVIIKGKSTHDAGLGLVAGLVRIGASDDDIVLTMTSLLPVDYSGNSLEELPGWISSAREKGFGEDGGEADSLTALLVKLALDEDLALSNDGNGNAYCTLPTTPHFVVHQVKSGIVKMWLRHLAYVRLGKPVSTSPLSDAVATIEAKALFESNAETIYSRLAGDHRSVEIDHGICLIAIDAEGYREAQTSHHKFVRGSGFQNLPMPDGGGGVEALIELLGLDRHNSRLLIAFLIGALSPSGPYFILLVEGEQGSGKSFFCEVIKRIIDPNGAIRLRLPEKPQDLMIQAKEYRLLNFDNASGIRADMSDALCTLSTGGGLAVRKLYTDADLSVLAYQRPFVLNGISGYASRPDLMERAIPIKLSPMGVSARRTESELLKEFEAILPAILADLYAMVARAIRTLEDVEPPRHLRMADAARWIKASAPSGSGEVIDAIAAAQDEFLLERINDDPLVNRLRKIAAVKPFEGYMVDLHIAILENVERPFDRQLPPGPSQLSKQLDRLKPSLAKAGIVIEFLPKDRRGRKVRISVTREEAPG